jgi:uncharacterized protein
LLAPSELAQLTERAESITASYECDVIIVTIDAMSDDAGAFEWAMDIFDDHGYGYGPNRSGVMLFISMEERDYYLIAHGYGNTAFTDYGKDAMIDTHILPRLRNNDFYGAFRAYINAAEEYLKLAREGDPVDVNSNPATRRARLITRLAITILLPALIALLICTIWKSQMKTARPARAAANYIPEGGFKLTGSADMFLYRTRTSVKIESSSSSSGGGGGGTSVNSRGFSGSGGKF